MSPLERPKWGKAYSLEWFEREMLRGVELPMVRAGSRDTFQMNTYGFMWHMGKLGLAKAAPGRRGGWRIAAHTYEERRELVFAVLAAIRLEEML